MRTSGYPRYLKIKKVPPAQAPVLQVTITFLSGVTPRDFNSNSISSGVLKLAWSL